MNEVFQNPGFWYGCSLIFLGVFGLGLIAMFGRRKP